MVNVFSFMVTRGGRCAAGQNPYLSGHVKLKFFSFFFCVCVKPFIWQIERIRLGNGDFNEMVSSPLVRDVWEVE